MSVTTQASAEASKNYILGQLDASTGRLVDVLVLTIRDSCFSIAVNVVVLILLLLILSLILLIVMKIISVRKAVYVFLIALVFMVILAIIFVSFCTFYARKQLNANRFIFTNFVASQEALALIDSAAGAYLLAAVTPPP